MTDVDPAVPAAEEVDPLFNEANEVKIEYNTIKFGKIGDFFKGTLTDNSKQMVNNLSARKEMQTVFEFKAKAGKLHILVNKQVPAEPTMAVPGEFYSLITSKPAILNQLKKAQLGQVVGLRFTETIKNKQPGFDDTKVIKVFLGEMDPEYQGESRGD